MTHKVPGRTLKDEPYETLASKGPEGCPYGLFYYGKKKHVRPGGDVYQDFRTRQAARLGNVNAIQWLWADTTAESKINCKITQNEPILRIFVEHAKSSYASNVAIRGKDESPLRNSHPTKKYLVFAARLGENDEDGIGEEREESDSALALSVRVMNGYLQHWYYGTGMPTFEIVKSNTWKLVEVDLRVCPGRS